MFNTNHVHVFARDPLSLIIIVTITPTVFNDSNQCWCEIDNLFKKIITDFHVDSCPGNALYDSI